MTPETRKTLLDLIAEYGNALERIQGEKDLLKAIEMRAVAKVRGDLEAQLDLLDTVRAAGAGERVTVEIRDAA